MTIAMAMSYELAKHYLIFPSKWKQWEGKWNWILHGVTRVWSLIEILGATVSFDKA